LNVKVLNLPSARIDDATLWQLPALAFVKSHALLGEPDSERLRAITNDNLAERDLLYTLAVMCSPDDEAWVARYERALGLHEIYGATQILADGAQYGIWTRMDAETTLSLCKRESHRDLLRTRLHKNRVAHFASGYILRRIVSLYQKVDTRRNASLAEAAATVEHFCSVNRMHGGKQENLTRNIWKKYKSVSHLWAAWTVIQDCGLGDTPIADWFPVFCGTSQWLLERAASITPMGRRQGETVLTFDEAWSLPDYRVPRSANGTIRERVWNEDPDAHDIRNAHWPPMT
jgi:hypothetical protein